MTFAREKKSTGLLIPDQRGDDGTITNFLDHSHACGNVKNMGGGDESPTPTSQSTREGLRIIALQPCREGPGRIG